MGAFGVVGIEHTFRNHAPLNRHVFTVVNGHGLVNTPTGRYMVQDKIFDIPGRYGIGILSRFVAKSDPDVPDDHLVSTNHEWVSFDANTIPRRGLPGNGNIGVFNAQVALEVYRS